MPLSNFHTIFYLYNDNKQTANCEPFHVISTSKSQISPSPFTPWSPLLNGNLFGGWVTVAYLWQVIRVTIKASVGLPDRAQVSSLCTRHWYRIYWGASHVRSFTLDWVAHLELLIPKPAAMEGVARCILITLALSGEFKDFARLWKYPYFDFNNCEQLGVR